MKNVTIPTREQIATEAYNLWRSEGCPDGRDQDFWFRAEAALATRDFSDNGHVSRNSPAFINSNAAENSRSAPPVMPYPAIPASTPRKRSLKNHGDKNML